MFADQYNSLLKCEPVHLLNNVKCVNKSNMMIPLYRSNYMQNTTRALASVISTLLLVSLCSVAFAATATEVIVDTNETGTSFVGRWRTAKSGEYYGGRTRFTKAGGNLDRYRFTPVLETDGTYEVFVWNNCLANRADNVRHIIHHANGTNSIEVNQNCDTGLSGDWLLLGSYPFSAGTNSFLEITDEGIVATQTTYVDADAARFVLVDGNTAPELSVSTIKLTLLPGEIADLHATAIDTEEGDLSEQIQWINETSGETGSGGSFIFAPTVGNHAVIVSVTDSEGLTSTTTVSVTVSTDPEPTPLPISEIIIDTNEINTSYVGLWKYTSAREYYGTKSLFAKVGGEVDRFRFTPTITASGTYEVYTWNACHSNRANNVPHIIQHAEGVNTVEVDQDCDTGTHGEWFLLGSYPFEVGNNAYLEITNEGIVSTGRSYIGADAARFVLISDQAENNKPVLTLSQTALNLIEGEVANLNASADDAEDGNLTDLIQWINETSGETDLGGSFVFAPTQGTHTVTASISDSGGLIASAKIVITVSEPPNTAPMLNLSNTSLELTEGEVASLSATATDAEDGDLSTAILWQDNLSSASASGNSFEFTPVLGIHSVNVSITDSKGLSADGVITIVVSEVPNTAPVLHLSQSSLTLFEGEIATLNATATDTEEGDLSASIQWRDNLSSASASGSSFVFTPALGTHNVNVSITDSKGLSANGVVTIVVSEIPNTAPVLHLSQSTLALFEGEIATLSATATDTEEGDLNASIQWLDNLSSASASGGTFVFTPTLGTHSVNVSVTDSKGLIASAIVAIVVVEAQPEPTPEPTPTDPDCGITCGPTGPIKGGGGSIPLPY